MCRCCVGLDQLEDVQGRESTSLCHGQIRTLMNNKYGCLKLHHVGYLIK
jgi:hypothetical protein